MVRPTPVTDQPAVVAWLEAFAEAVRGRDHDTARALFDPDAEGFGTVADRWLGIDALVRDQWRDVWGRTTDFAFDIDHATCWASGDLVVVASDWSSIGVEDGGRLRAGRATIGLFCTSSGAVAVHSHFSMAPGTRA